MTSLRYLVGAFLVIMLVTVSVSDGLRLPFTLPNPKPSALAIATALSLTVGAQSASAISGGGLDFANLDITASQDFAGKTFSRKDFSQVIARGTSFHESVLVGCRFYKALLIETDFSGADITGAR